MLKSVFIVFTGVLLMCSCKQEEVNAEAIIDKAIKVAGGDRLDNATVDFDFRNRHYKAIRKQGIFQYEREFTDSLGIIKDVLSNDGYKRFLNDEPYEVHDTMAVKYTSSVNAVHYFSVLPYGLNAEAAIKTYVGLSTIKGERYHVIKVTFTQDGGGEDFEDVFLYWFDVNTFKMDYLAYSYEEDGELGLRFREAYNQRYLEGIRFLDFNNYKPQDNSAALIDLSALFKNGYLKLLSKIELENIKVTY